MNSRNSWVALASILALSSGRAALAVEYAVDKTHSRVGFTVRHIVSKVSGEFKEYDGTIQFDEKDPSKASVEFTVQAKSINTNTEKRDEHLRGADFFEVEKYPTLTFKNGKLKAAGKGRYKLAGDLTMHGVTKPVTFDVEYLGADKDPWGGTRAGFTASAKIKRKDYGLTWNKTLESGGLLVGDDVQINLEIEGVAK